MSKYLGSAGKSCSTYSYNKVGTCHIKFYRFSRTRNKQGIVWFIENMKKNFAYVKGTLRCEQSLGYTYCNSSTPFQSEETKHINWALQILKTWRKNIAKLLFGYDTSGGAWGVCAALGLSNGIINLFGTFLEVIYFVYTLVSLCSLTMTVDNLMLLYLYYKIKVSESYIIIFELNHADYDSKGLLRCSCEPSCTLKGKTILWRTTTSTETKHVKLKVTDASSTTDTATKLLWWSPTHKYMLLLNELLLTN
jgi:hypothetical protein